MENLPSLSIVPANQTSCEGLLAVFGSRGYTGRCLCQRFRTTTDEWWHDPIPREERVFEAAGFEEVSHPSKWCCVMRIDF